MSPQHCPESSCTSTSNKENSSVCVLSFFCRAEINLMLVFSRRSRCCSKPNSPDMTDMDSVQRSLERSGSQRRASERAEVDESGGCPVPKPRHQRSKWTFHFTLEWAVRGHEFLPPSTLRQRLLSEQIEDARGVQAGVKFGWSRIRGSPDLSPEVNSIPFQSIHWGIFHYSHMWNCIIH